MSAVVPRRQDSESLNTGAGDSAAMIMSRTPFRISFFGGGTDYPAWYRQHGGAVIGTTGNQYCYISVRSLPPFFEHRHRIGYARIERPQHIAEIQHPAVRCVLREYGIDDGGAVQHYGDG